MEYAASEYSRGWHFPCKRKWVRLKLKRTTRCPLRTTCRQSHQQVGQTVIKQAVRHYVCFKARKELVMLNHLTKDEIRSKAYELWEHAGCPDGGAEIYWAQAQTMLSGGDEAPSPSSTETGTLPHQTAKDD
jgi:hypothetical protein